MARFTPTYLNLSWLEFMLLSTIKQNPEPAYSLYYVHCTYIVMIIFQRLVRCFASSSFHISPILSIESIIRPFPCCTPLTVHLIRYTFPCWFWLCRCWQKLCVGYVVEALWKDYVLRVIKFCLRVINLVVDHFLTDVEKKLFGKVFYKHPRTIISYSPYFVCQVRFVEWNPGGS